MFCRFPELSDPSEPCYLNRDSSVVTTAFRYRSKKRHRLMHLLATAQRDCSAASRDSCSQKYSQSVPGSFFSIREMYVHPGSARWEGEEEYVEIFENYKYCCHMKRLKPLGVTNIGTTNITRNMAISRTLNGYNSKTNGLSKNFFCAIVFNTLKY